jgi:drug/metabolite transporter (DMT)-like permease
MRSADLAADARGISVLLLGERVGPRRWIAVAIGFVAVFIIIRPGFADVHWAMFLPLGVASASRSTRSQPASWCDRSLGHDPLLHGDRRPGGDVGGAALRRVTPDLKGWALMALMGVFGGASHLVLIRAFTIAPASMLAPFAYVQIVWSIIVGFAIFGDFPDVWTLVAAAVIAASGLYVIHRERQAMRAARAAAAASGGTSPQG